MRFSKSPSESLALFLIATDFRRKGKAELFLGNVVFLVLGFFLFTNVSLFLIVICLSHLSCIYHSTE